MGDGMGKQLKFLFGLFILLIACFSIVSFAQTQDCNNYSFEMDKINVNEIPESFRNSLKISETEVTNQNIRNFDVDSNGNIIICLCNTSVNVYNDSLEFLYSISYSVNGTAIAFWYNKNVALYLSKSDILIVLDKKGISEAYKVKNTAENSKIYREIRNKRVYDSNVYSYKLSYTSSFQKIMFINPTKMIRNNNGTEQIIYENEKATSDIIIKLVSIIIFFTTTLIIICIRIKRNKSNLII